MTFVLLQRASSGRNLDAMHGAMVSHPAPLAKLLQDLAQGDRA